MKSCATVAVLGLMVCLLAVCISGVSAEETQADKKFWLKGSLSVDTYTSYVDKVSGELLNDGPVVHPNLIVMAEPSGVYLYIGLFTNFKKFNQHSANSMEYAVGIEREAGIVKLDLGYGYSDIKNSKGDVHYFYSIIEFREVVGKLTPYVSLELDLPVKKDILEGGFMYSVGGKYPFKVSEQPIDIDLSLGGNDGINGYRPEKISYARLTLSTLSRFGKLEVTPEINFQKRIGYSYENGGIAKDKIYGVIKISLPFDIR